MERGKEEKRRPGRKPKSESGAAIATTVKLAPVDRERLRAVAKELAISQAEVMVMGIDAAERKARRRRRG